MEVSGLVPCPCCFTSGGAGVDGRFGEEKNLLLVPAIKSRLLGREACDLVTMLLRHPYSLLVTCISQ